MIVLGADHAGFNLKEKIRRHLEAQGTVVRDLSPVLVRGDDYPDVAKRCAVEVRKQRRHLGILICGSGGGVCMAANKISGIRATQAESVKTVTLVRRDDDANILCLGARVTTAPAALQIVQAFLSQRPSSAVRHLRRRRKIFALEHPSR